MVSSSRHRLLEVEPLGNLTLVRFTVADILSYGLIDLIGLQLRSLVEDGGSRRILLTFQGVERLSTALVGQVIALHHRLQRHDGRLALCAIPPELATIFNLFQLQRVLPIYADEQTALQEMQRPQH